jgi:nucleoside-diphosphate-sugar epimerase
MTGGTGLIGRWTSAQLSAEGHKLALLVRNADLRQQDFAAWISAHGGNAENIQLIEGDLKKPDMGLSAKAAADLQTVRHVFHLGASFDWGLARQAAHQINVGGTTAVLNFAAGLPALERFVLVSGYMVAAKERWAPFGIAKPDDISPMPVTRSQLDRMYKKLGSYEASKLEADLLTRQVCHDKQLPLTIINPATVIGSAHSGELDQDLGFGAIAQAIWRKMFTAIPGSKPDWIPLTTIDYVSTFLAKAPFLPATCNNEYTLLDESTPRASEMTAMVATHLGRKAATRFIPKNIMKFLLRSGLEKLSGTSAESLSFLESYYFDTGPANKIAEQINLEKTDIRRAILRTTDQMAAHHFGKAASPFKAGTYSYQEIAGSRTLVGGDKKAASHVLLHGLPLNSDSWHPMLEQMQVNALFADLPGLGRSVNRFNIHSTDWMTSLCNDLQEAPIVVGHSLGTSIAVDYAHKYPDRVKGLVLIAPYFLQQKPKAELRLSLPLADLKAILTSGGPVDDDILQSTYKSIKNPGGLMRIGAKPRTKTQTPAGTPPESLGFANSVASHQR